MNISPAECTELKRRWELEEQQRLKREKLERQRRLEREARERQRRLEREARERQRRLEREAQERQRQRLLAGMIWETPSAQQCTSYNIREYSSRLMNIPWGDNWVEACNMTAVTIRDITLTSPDKCEDRGFWGGMHGYWYVLEQPECVPFWGGFEFERVTSRLWNINRGDDWDVMCSSTPAEINGIHYAAPDSCETKSVSVISYGIWGHWDVPDSKCTSAESEPSPTQTVDDILE
ncbi:hypothetical protein K439DRAFT_1402674 [Ramaria rubella]|nr:hypothetical protein K439DRAFT_1402674 [Ramaria rubella]